VSIDPIFDANREWAREAGATASALANLRKTVPVELPEEFYLFYSRSNGGAGELGIWPGWFALWKAEDILSLNDDYGVATEYPGYFGFGSNGGGELLAFEVNAGRCEKVAMVAFIGGEPSVIANSFSEFVRFVGIRHDAVG
jgi:hypothetical protein